MKNDKLKMVGAFAFGYLAWGLAGYAFGGLEGAKAGVIGLVIAGCFAHTFGSVWRYLFADDDFQLPVPRQSHDDNVVDDDGDTDDELSPDISEALDSFRDDSHLYPYGPPSQHEAVMRILRDWLTGHGYLELAPDREDAN